MLFDALVVGYVRTNGARAIATIAALALGVAIALGAALAERTLAQQLSGDVGALDDGVALRVTGDGMPLDERVLARLEDLPGVAEARPIVDGSALLGATPAHPDAGRLVRLEGVDLLRALPGVAAPGERVPGTFAPDGDPVSTSDAIERRGIVISSALARELQLRRGSNVSALTGSTFTDFRIAGVLPQSATGVDALTAFTDLATAQPLFASIGRLDRIDIVASGDPALVRANIARALPLGALVEVPQRRAGALADLGGELVVDFEILGALGLVAGAFLCADAVGTSVTRRLGEIGTLRALGVTRGAIARTFVLEGSLYGTVGAIAGVVLGALAARSLLVTLSLGNGLTTIPFDVSLDPLSLALAFACGPAVAALASLGPALRAAAVAPAQATQRQTGAASSRRSRAIAALRSGACAVAAVFAASLHAKLACNVALVAFVISVLGLVSRGAARGLVRLARRARAAPFPAVDIALLALRAGSRRVGIAATTLAFGLAAAVALGVSSASLRGAVETWAAQTYPGDIVVRPLALGAHRGFMPAAVVRATALPGIASVAVERETSIGYEGATVRVRGAGTLAELTRPREQKPHAAPTPAPAVLSMRFASTYGLRNGATIVLPTPSGALPLRVAGVRANYASGGEVVTLDPRTFARAFRDRAIDAFAIGLAPGANLEDVRRRVIERLRPERLEVRIAKEERTRALALFDRTFELAAAAGVLVVLLSLGGVASALSAFVLEGRRELALLRLVGATRSVVRAVVFGQSAAIAVLGCGAGLVLGLAVASVQLATPDPAAVVDPIAVRVPVPLVGAIVLGTALAALVAGVLPARAATAIAADRARSEHR